MDRSATVASDCQKRGESLVEAVYEEDKNHGTKGVHEYEFVLLSPDEFEKEREDYRIPSPDTFHGDGKTSKQYLHCCKFQSAATESLSTIVDAPSEHSTVAHVFDTEATPPLEFRVKSESPSKCSNTENISSDICETSKPVLPVIGGTLLDSLDPMQDEQQLGAGNVNERVSTTDDVLIQPAKNTEEKVREKHEDRPMEYQIAVPEYSLSGSSNRFIQVTLLNNLEDGSDGVGEAILGAGQLLTIPKLHSCLWLDCNTHFLSVLDLSNHVATSHLRPTKDQFYYCLWKDCARDGKGFNARYKMVSHIRTHTGEKPHLCLVDNCERSFTRLENLKIHMRTHTGEKPYQCPYEGCTRSYANSSDRFKHTKTHYNKKPFHCKTPGCGKSYTDPSSLRKHCKSHSK